MNEILEHLVNHTNQVRLYHWKTKLFPRHKATDKYLKIIDSIIDNVIESLQGGRETRIVDSFSVKYRSVTDSNASNYLKEHKRWLISEFPKLLKKDETDILNLRDELLAAVNRLLYLFTLK